MSLLRLLPLLLLLSQPAFADARPPAQLYRDHCAACHGPERLGAIGPALLPENLGRLKPAQAEQVIREGRPLTQMPPFSDKLNGEEIASLAALIFTPPAQQPRWDLTEIKASHIKTADLPGHLDKPIFEVADPLNMFVVVETGDHHATLLDGDKLTPIHRFKTRFALHGGPKFSPSGRYVFFMSRDGWVTKYDLWGLTVVAEIRAGINSRNIAVSADNRYVLVGNYLPHTLVVLSADDLSPVQLIPVVDHKGNSSRVSAVYTAPPRNSFIAALKDIPELWLINYEALPPAGFSGWVHDFNEESGDADRSHRFPVRRITVNSYLDDFLFDQGYIALLGASREGVAEVVDLDIGRPLRKVDLPGMPHLASGISFRSGERTLVATPNLKQGAVTVLTSGDWEVVKKIETLGPGFFMRSHEKSPYAWVDNLFSKHKDTVQVIDKERLEVVKNLTPTPGKAAAHVEFTRDGRYALLSIWEEDGALVVYDARTLEEVKRLPMKKPSGKYNVWNKIRYAEGTSH